MDKQKTLLLIRYLLKSFKDHPELFTEMRKFDSDPNESTPENHMRLAIHHSHMAGHHADQSNFDTHMRHTMHSDVALSHYQAAGHTRQAAIAEHGKHMKENHLSPKDAKEPHNENALKLNWQKKNGKRFPSGIGYDYSK